MNEDTIESGRRVVVRHEHPVALADMQVMAKSIADSGYFGVKTEAQAMALMLLCQAENIHPVMAMRRYHIIENKPAYRADALQGEFERDGAILWHVRNDTECSATFWRDKDTIKDNSREAVKRAMARYKELKAGKDADDLAWPNEITIIRTFKDAVEKRVACSWDSEKGEWKLKKNWKQSPRQMLHARCLTEGVRAMNPGLVAGIYTEDEIHDFDPDNSDHRPQAEIIERNVREATANAADAKMDAADATVAGVEAEVQVVLNKYDSPYGPTEITEANYKDRIAHFGKPSGRIIGRRVGEMEPQVIEWLYHTWTPSLTPSASDDDMRLKRAVELAHNVVSAQAPTAGDGAADTSKDAGGQPKETAAPSRAKPHDVGAKQAAINDLRQRIDGMVITEEQAISYLIKYFYPGVGADWKELDTMPLNVLLEWCVPVNWKSFVAQYEREAKPQVSQEKPARKRARRK